MCVLKISGKAFLWHQIRCIVAVLFRIGAGKEEPAVVRKLLDIQTHPRRPQYSMASELPLNLFSVEFDAEDNIVWNYDLAAVTVLIRQIQTLWSEHSVKSIMLRTVLCEIESIHSLCTGTDNGSSVPVFQAESLVSTNYRRKDYVPLLEMQSCLALEEKLGNSPAKRRKHLDATADSDKFE